MIELYTWGTPNGKKASVMLEEVGLPYEVHPIQYRQGRPVQARLCRDQSQFQDPGDRRSRRARRQADQVFESGAILIYLAEKTGKLLAAEPRARLNALEWLMFQMGGVGPMFGQSHHFLRQAQDNPYAPSAMSRKSAGSTASCTGGSGQRPISPAIIRSPTWPHTPGSRATNGTASSLPNFPMSSAGSRRSRRVRRWSAA